MKKQRIGFIGTGGIARGNHLPAFARLKDRCELVAVCDVDRGVAESTAEQYGIRHVYSEYEAMVSGGELDAVIVSTPNRFHCAPTLAALGAGLHVLCEKPLAMNGAEARLMCRAARDSGKVLQVGLQTRFSPAAEFLKSYVDRGQMGDVYFARAQALRRRGVPGWGVFIDKELQGGGPLIDMGVHVLDLTLWLMGHPKPVSASGQTWQRLGTNPGLYNGMGDYDRSKFTVEDFAVGLIRFENGAALALEASFMANIEGNPFQTQLFGERSGALLKPFAAEDALRIYTEEDRQLFDMTPANIPSVEAPHIRAAAAFLDAVEGKRACSIPGEQAMVLNAIFDAMYQSAESGKEEPVEIDY